jgi:hypothetical protein
MTVPQEDALYDFLDSVVEPFTVRDAVSYIRQQDSTGFRRLNEEAKAFIISRHLAFPLDKDRWLSRRGYFESARFAIKPTRIEILNGILIPAHRCVPFANPLLLPHEYRFFWHGEALPPTTSEGPPEDFYPYYSIFGEEYAPQYIARDNPENERAFNADPYEDPPEVSVRTVDLRSFYRENSFVPGNRLVVRLTDWKTGAFEIEGVEKNSWKNEALKDWAERLERGFFTSFEKIGPGASTEDQIAFAFWYGGKELKDVPAYSLEEFLYEKTDRIETVPFGMETRYWYAGKEIPDRGPWSETAGPPDKTELEEILFQYGIPISEYVIQSYIRDSIFRGEENLSLLLERIVPHPITLRMDDEVYLSRYIMEMFQIIRGTYNIFTDKAMGPLRQRVGELHSAVVALVSRLSSGDINPSWLPKHTFVMLSQIQGHAAHVLEDLDVEEIEDEEDLESIENALDGMIETYEDIKERIEASLKDFRHATISVFRKENNQKDLDSGRTIQVSIAGTEVWRRLEVRESCTLATLHRVLQTLFGWSGTKLHAFVVDGDIYGTETADGARAERERTIGDLVAQGCTEFTYDYDYGAEWELRLTILNPVDGSLAQDFRCVAGAGASPPENIGGPLRFRRFVTALQKGEGSEKTLAQNELGKDYDPQSFDVNRCNELLAAIHPPSGGGKELI